MSDLNPGGHVRSGEELPLEQLLPWLAANCPQLQGKPNITQYSGGASNWTYCLDFGDTEVILRRAPAGKKAKGAHDMAREHNIQQALQPHFPLVPNMLALCQDEEIMGSDFYLMEKVDGFIPRRNLPRSLNLNSSQTNALCKSAIDTLIQLHQVDINATGLASIGKGEGYIERQILGWNKRYRNAKTWNVGSGISIMNWLEANMPKTERQALIHNDYRLDNLVLDPQQPDQVLAVLDWEMATIGDPLMDLGNSLAYWVQADDDPVMRGNRRQPTSAPGMLTRAQVIDYYCQQAQIDCDDFTFYEVYGLFRLTGIVQQLYHRYHTKQTRNPAFKNMWLFSNYLLWRCQRLIKASGRRSAA
ncbi:phosphotransferase family protein [Ferrimonas lipolytica]|uniref:Phosphotransferase family protein n=1 Tax=Ferrimonas lipolytica TaxID=2724191 RepID=A0A6H1UHZ6_9GAMM|nr:phosphotransferase family protein [Ferrimonas lipolytica]QIZ78727.1 phosphotransferase family protein [Ferrimonas lipolytica]